MRQYIPALDPTRAPPATVAVARRQATGRAPTRPLGAPGQLGAMWRYLQRTTAAAIGGDPAAWPAAHRAVSAMQFFTQRVIDASRPQGHLPPVVLAGNLLAFTGGEAVLQLARAQSMDLSAQAALAELLRRPLDRGARAALLAQMLGPKVLLVLLQARLVQLKAINEILLAWGEHLRKLAKLDKIAHARAVKAAHERARQALHALEAHFDALGVQRARAHLASVRRGVQVQAARAADRLVPRWVAASSSPVLRSWPNLSQLAALTLPLAYGVHIQGTPQLPPGARRADLGG